MIISPPKAFLDTQIVIDAEKGKISQSDWSLAVSYLRHATRYCISPLTIGELIYAMANGAPEYFEQHKRRLRVLLKPGHRAEVFDFINYFFAEQLGLRVERPAHLEKDFLGTIELILEAPSKEALLRGFRRKGENSHQTAKVRIDRFAQEHYELIEKYLQFMRNRRERSELHIPPDKWASFLPIYYGVSEAVADPLKIAEMLSANYEFEMSVNNLMKSAKFSLAKNRSDLIDGQQLCYLSDPTVVFITNDSDFKNRINKSSQLGRIKTFTELLSCATRRASLF